jgi:hypothetical protein
MPISAALVAALFCIPEKFPPPASLVVLGVLATAHD